MYYHLLLNPSIRLCQIRTWVLGGHHDRVLDTMVGPDATAAVYQFRKLVIHKKIPKWKYFEFFEELDVSTLQNEQQLHAVFRLWSSELHWVDSYTVEISLSPTIPVLLLLTTLCKLWE